MHNADTQGENDMRGREGEPERERETQNEGGRGRERQRSAMTHTFLYVVRLRGGSEARMSIPRQTEKEPDTERGR